MDKSNIFRKEALERLSSPEQLDQLMQIVTPRSWLPLVVLGGLMSVGVVWSFVGKIPVTTTGRGVIVYNDPPQPGEPSTQLQGVAYFSASEIAQIQPGMKVLLIPDMDANGDYHWSTGTSMMAPIAGMPAIARVTLEEKAPIAFVLPFLGQGQQHGPCKNAHRLTDGSCGVRRGPTFLKRRGTTG